MDIYKYLRANFRMLILFLLGNNLHILPYQLHKCHSSLPARSLFHSRTSSTGETFVHSHCSSAYYLLTITVIFFVLCVLCVLHTQPICSHFFNDLKFLAPSHIKSIRYESDLVLFFVLSSSLFLVFY